MRSVTHEQCAHAQVKPYLLTQLCVINVRDRAQCIEVKQSLIAWVNQRSCDYGGVIMPRPRLVSHWTGHQPARRRLPRARPRPRPCVRCHIIISPSPSDLDLPDPVLRVCARLPRVVPYGRLRRVVGGGVDLGVRRRVPHGRSRVVQRDAQASASPRSCCRCCEELSCKCPNDADVDRRSS